MFAESGQKQGSVPSCSGGRSSLFCPMKRSRSPSPSREDRDNAGETSGEHRGQQGEASGGLPGTASGQGQLAVSSGFNSVASVSGFLDFSTLLRSPENFHAWPNRARYTCLILVHRNFFGKSMLVL